jgi:hypothetical protein
MAHDIYAQYEYRTHVLRRIAGAIGASAAAPAAALANRRATGHRSPSRPPYGLANVKNETYTAEGPISYWNGYVAVT